MTCNDEHEKAMKEAELRMARAEADLAELAALDACERRGKPSEDAELCKSSFEARICRAENKRSKELKKQRENEEREAGSTILLHLDPSLKTDVCIYYSYLARNLDVGYGELSYAQMGESDDALRRKGIKPAPEGSGIELQLANARRGQRMVNVRRAHEKTPRRIPVDAWNAAIEFSEHTASDVGDLLNMIL